MTISLPSEAEKLGQRATSLSACSTVNLHGVRADVEEALKHFGRLGIFEEYTKHDMSHVDGMLGLYNWLIPPDTREKMTPAEWLLLTLATYYHDFALIVTRVEYERRSNTAFPDYVQQLAEARDRTSVDYRARVETLSGEARDHFLYQEFVRANHAKRIRSWITGAPDESLGYDPQLAEQVAKSLEGVSPAFIDDLGLVCESHHLEDLDNTSKYPVDRPYGRSADEEANVQYVAILLRTADLLHITEDRAPSVALRLVNPSDPISHAEWYKQNAVTRVRAAPVRNIDGEVDRSLPPHTIEVHARVRDENSFFGLTSYLQYADRELEQSFKWALTSVSKHKVPHRFPWRKVDTDHVIPAGFEPTPFEFQIDQYKVLQLLTGHTLYNDTNVVIRELVQNAIDAVRLQQLESPVAGYEPTVVVRWDPAASVLEVIDNGTGMTQQIIEHNFLRVGSSRYQEPQFKRDYPTFTSISRFGIGVLSSFMIADEVRVVTVHQQEGEARELKLRSVHGKYLIRRIPKSDEMVPELARAHGTSVRMRIRPSAELGDVEEILRYWVILPRCRVLFEPAEPGAQPKTVGFTDAKQALESLNAELLAGKDERRPIAVRHRIVDGYEIAYSVRWDPWFRQWDLLLRSDRSGFSAFAGVDPGSGVCVEGIRVLSGPPGFDQGRGVIALVNVVGRQELRTNVARTGLEPSASLDDLLRFIYETHTGHINTEISEMCRKRGFSATRAGTEANFLIRPLVESTEFAPNLMTEAVASVRAYLVEFGDERTLLSLRELERYDTLVSFDGALSRNAEHLLATVPGKATLRGLLGLMRLDAELDRDLPFLCNWNPMTWFGKLLTEHWDIADVERRFNGDVLQFRWRRLDDEQRLWVAPGPRTAPPRVRDVLARVAQHLQGRARGDEVWVARRPIASLSDFPHDGILLGDIMLVLRESLRKFATPRVALSDEELAHLVGGALLVVIVHRRPRFGSHNAFDQDIQATDAEAREHLEVLERAGYLEYFDRDELLRSLMTLSFDLYEAYRGFRGLWSF